MTADEAAERVALGAVFLDEQEPGWVGRINLKRLNMANCHLCVLGQLYGTYPEGVIRFFCEDGWSSAVELGFNIDFVIPEIADYIPLRAAWIAEIQNRLLVESPYELRLPGTHLSRGRRAGLAPVGR